MAKLAVGCLIGASIVAAGPVSNAEALSGSEFIPGLIITDNLFYDANAMTETEVQQFLAARGSGLAGMTFSVSSRSSVYSERTGNLVCQAFEGGTLSAATIIYRAQKSCGISAKVLLVTLQKEQGLVTKSAPSQSALDRAMGFACPDTAPCAPTTLGFGNQVYSGAQQLNTYKAGAFARQPGWQTIGYNPDPDCGSTQLYIQNYATAALYNYTPYQPNQAALANLGGVGDNCSSYGNRNFWYYYQNWFGSTIGSSDPHLIVPPSVGGTSVVGSTLTANPGSWTGSPTFAYVWLRCTGSPSAIGTGVPAGCVTISSSTPTTYQTTADDVGKYIAVQVTATNSYGSMTAGGSFSVPVGFPANLTPPSLSGSPIIGSTWTVDVGTWAGTPMPTIAIFWLRCAQPVTVAFTVVPPGCVVISGANATTYVSTWADAGKYLTAQVAGNSPLGFTLAGPVNTVPMGLPVNITPPTVSGSPVAGSTWTVDVGTWTGVPAPTMAIYWLRCDQPVSSPYTLVPSWCTIISGARGLSYTATSADAGKYLTAQVAGNNSLGFSIAGPVNTIAIQSGKPANAVPPTVSGAAPAGSTWTVDVGTWTGVPAPTMAIYWLRCDQPVSSPYTLVPSWCTIISGARGLSYTATSADAGKYLTAQVAGNNSLGFSIAGPVNTIAIQSGKPANAVPPTVSGAAPAGSTWTVDVGMWTGVPAPTIAIFWLRCAQPVTVAFTVVPPGCVVISGANATTYVSTWADAGKYLTAQVAGNSPLGFALAGPPTSIASQ